MHAQKWHMFPQFIFFAALRFHPACYIFSSVFYKIQGERRWTSRLWKKILKRIGLYLIRKFQNIRSCFLNPWKVKLVFPTSIKCNIGNLNFDIMKKRGLVGIIKFGAFTGQLQPLPGLKGPFSFESSHNKLK